jgi:hypothetical protein
MKKVNKMAKEATEATLKIIEEVKRKKPGEYETLPVITAALNEKGTKADQPWTTLPKPNAESADLGQEVPEDAEQDQE